MKKTIPPTSVYPTIATNTLVEPTKKTMDFPNNIPNVPKFQFSLGLNYTRPIAGDWEGMGAVDVQYRDSVDAYFASNKDFNLRLDSYALLNLRAGLINGPWSITAFARNLTNKRAQVSAINSTQDPNALLTVRPRTIGLTLTRKF